MQLLADGGRDHQRPKCQPVTQGTAPQGARYAKASHGVGAFERGRLWGLSFQVWVHGMTRGPTTGCGGAKHRPALSCQKCQLSGMIDIVAPFSCSLVGRRTAGAAA